MINGKEILAIIPARSGSKGLPGKNIKDLCGKPLIAWTIEAAKKCSYIDEIIVSTDCQKITNLALKENISVPFLRPNELSQDDSTTLSVVKHAIDFYHNELSRSFEYIALLEPTSPLREPSDLNQMFEKIDSLSEKYDAIISLGEVQQSPSILKRIRGLETIPYFQGVNPILRRQDEESVYFPYGVGYIIKTKTLVSEETFYPARCTYHIIKRSQCYEVDDIYDFMAIESIIKMNLEKN